MEALIPKRLVSDSAASRNSEVEIALSLLASTGTSAKLRLIVSKKSLLWAEAILKGRSRARNLE